MAKDINLEKARNHELISLGGLFAVVGLDKVNKNELTGLLVTAKYIYNSASTDERKKLYQLGDETLKNRSSENKIIKKIKREEEAKFKQPKTKFSAP